MPPDHANRAEGVPCFTQAPGAVMVDAFKAGTTAALGKYAADYHAYFMRHSGKLVSAKQELDPVPRVVLVPGVGRRRRRPEVVYV